MAVLGVVTSLPLWVEFGCGLVVPSGLVEAGSFRQLSGDGEQHLQSKAAPSADSKPPVNTPSEEVPHLPSSGANG